EAPVRATNHSPTCRSFRCAALYCFFVRALVRAFGLSDTRRAFYIGNRTELKKRTPQPSTSLLSTPHTVTGERPVSETDEPSARQKAGDKKGRVIFSEPLIRSQWKHSRIVNSFPITMKYKG